MSKCTLKAETQKTLKYGIMGAFEVYIDDKLFILPEELVKMILVLDPLGELPLCCSFSTVAYF